MANKLPKLKEDTSEMVLEGFTSIQAGRIEPLIKRISNDDAILGATLLRMRVESIAKNEVNPDSCADILCGMLFMYLLFEAAAQQE